MLRAAPGIRAIAIFDEMIRRHPELGAGIRRTIERRIRSSAPYCLRVTRRMSLMTLYADGFVASVFCLIFSSLL